MRVTRLFVASFAFTIFAASATGQQAPAPTRSVDDYVCAFAGECSKQPNADNSIAAPSTRGFRLSVPERHATPDAAQARSPGANGASAASRTAVGSRSASTRPQVASRRGNAGKRAVAAQQRRMDLRVSFLLGSAQLTDQAREEAKAFATALQLPELASKRFRIEGHTDSSVAVAAGRSISDPPEAACTGGRRLSGKPGREQHSPGSPRRRFRQAARAAFRELAGKSPRRGGAALIQVA